MYHITAFDDINTFFEPHLNWYSVYTDDYESDMFSNKTIVFSTHSDITKPGDGRNLSGRYFIVSKSRYTWVLRNWMIVSYKKVNKGFRESDAYIFRIKFEKRFGSHDGNKIVADIKMFERNEQLKKLNV